MKKAIIIHDDRIEILRDGYNLIEHTIYCDSPADALRYAIVEAMDSSPEPELRDGLAALQELTEWLEG